MPDRVKERIWTYQSDDTTPGPTCRVCDAALQPGDQVVTCPRCKAVHHLDCWVKRGGCTTPGCFQTADPELGQDVPPPRDPPLTDPFAWVPLALTLLIVAMLIGGIIWTKVRGDAAGGTITVMVPAGQHLYTIEQTVRDYNQEVGKSIASVLSVPIDPQELYYEQKLVILLAAKQAPDIIILPYNRFRVYAEEGILRPLDHLLSEVADIGYGSRLEAGIVNGRLYGLPNPGEIGLFAVTNQSRYPTTAEELLLRIVRRIPLEAGLDDRKAAVVVPAEIPLPASVQQAPTQP
jgi:hypothetical protein